MKEVQDELMCHMIITAIKKIRKLETAVKYEGSATEQKWHPRFQDLKISLRSQNSSGVSRFHIDFKISLRFIIGYVACSYKNSS